MEIRKRRNRESQRTSSKPRLKFLSSRRSSTNSSVINQQQGPGESLTLNDDQIEEWKQGVRMSHGIVDSRRPELTLERMWNNSVKLNEANQGVPYDDLAPPPWEHVDRDPEIKVDNPMDFKVVANQTKQLSRANGNRQNFTNKRFVVTPQGELLVDRNHSENLEDPDFHESFTGWRVQTAGHLTTSRFGRVRSIRNSSGHYKPTPLQHLKAVERLKKAKLVPWSARVEFNQPSLNEESPADRKERQKNWTRRGNRRWRPFRRR